jgi:hypothetical protein
MLKMTCSSKYHCKFILVTIVDAQLVFIDPPGWITAVIPASFQLYYTVGKEKKRS